MRLVLALALGLVLAGCTEKEPSETELQSALQVFVEDQLSAAFVSPEQAAIQGAMSGDFDNFMAQTMGAAMLQDLSVSVSNVRKIECVALGKKRFECDVIADINTSFGDDDMNNLMQMMGVPLRQRNVSTNIVIADLENEWVVLREN